MKLFVIGGSGHLGRRLLYELAYDPAVSIVAISRGDPPPDLRLKNIEWIKADTGSPNLYAHRLDGTDLLLHMGGVRNPARPFDRDGLMAASVTPLERLVKEVRRRDVGLFLHVGDVCALGDTRNVTGDEDHRRAGGYGSDFEESHALCLELVESLKPDRKMIAALAGPTFGARDPGFLQPLLERAAQGTLGTVVGAGHFLSPIHVDDLKEGLLQLILKGDDNRRYILCGEPIELCNLLAMAAGVSGRHPPSRRSDGLIGKLHAGVLGRYGLSPFTPSLAAYLLGGSYAYESHRAKKELRWSHGVLRDRLASTLKESGVV